MFWYDRDIRAGAEWQKEISKQINEADIILLLVSASFIDSDYCYSIEMQQALKHHETGKSQVIPIILSPVLWQETPFGKLQSLPKDGKPVTGWRNRNEAFFEIARSIQEAVLKLTRKTTKDQDATINTVISAYRTSLGVDKKHFKLTRKYWQRKQHSLPYVQHDYIQISLNNNNDDIVFLRRNAYSSLGDLLNELYMGYLEKDSDPFTYGKDWLLGYDQGGRSYRREYRRLILPWEWLQTRSYIKSEIVLYI